MNERLDRVSIRRMSSFIYDVEPKFPFRATQNAAHIEYSRRGLSYLMHQRCALKNVSRAGAIIEIPGLIEPPASVTLDVPDSRAGKIGCVRWGGNSLIRRNGRLTLRLRFLSLLSEPELANILAHSQLQGEQRDFSFFV